MARSVFAALLSFVLALTLAVQHASAQPAPAAAPAPTVIVAEGEFFKPQPKNDVGGESRPSRNQGWRITPQDYSYASHNYGGMWVMNGAVIGAPADSVDAVATQKITVPVAGAYRVWSKYQAPPYFNYMHKIDVIQGGKTVYSHVYGKVDALRFWSFSEGMHKQIWWFWGIDHDAAEAPKEMATLAAGEAELRITSLAQPQPAGDRFIDFIVLTTNPEDTYDGFKPYGIGSPFMREAMRATRLYARFKNTTAKPAVLTAYTVGHMQPDYGAHNDVYPAKDQPVAAGQWSPWFNLGTILRLGHDEGVWASLPDAASFEIQVARDPAGTDMVGDVTIKNGEAFVVPIDIAWNKESKVLTSHEHSNQIIELSKTKWRTANGGKKPQKIAYYGAFRVLPGQPWVNDLKDALGYNTQLPDNYNHIKKDGYFQHAPTANELQALAKTLTPQQKADFRIVSFGDEISLGEINYTDPAENAKFAQWAQAKKLTAADLGVDPASVKLSKTDPKIAWYSNIFSEEERFAAFAAQTKLAEELLNPTVMAGANYSPHGAPQYYGPIYQWVDIFKFRGMSAFWSEDYIFSVPESPQIFSWTIATIRCAIKYHNLPMHLYVMPHAPGQVASNFRRSMLFAVGAGALDIDNFWVAPAENFTENFIAWNYVDTFKATHEAIYDSGEVENVSVGGKPRPTRVAIVLSKATDFNEPKLKVDPAADAVAKICDNFPQGGWQQTLCRKDQQMLYLALKHAQHGVELITEDDINDGFKGLDILANYDVIYFAGEWIEDHAAKKLDAWVKNGGVLYATAGLGHLNQYNTDEPALLHLLGIKSVTTTKNAYQLRPLLELPIAPPIDTLTLDGGGKISAIGMKQVLTVDSSSGAKVIGKWSDGSAAVTERDYGKGKAFAVGTLAGHTYYKTGTKPVPWARGGFKNLYAPLDFDANATKLALLGVDAKPSIARDVVSSDPHVESEVLDNTAGTLVTLINWANEPAKGVKITLPLAFKPASTKLISAGKAIPFTYENNAITFTLDVNEAEYVLLNK